MLSRIRMLITIISSKNNIKDYVEDDIKDNVKIYYLHKLC